MSLDRERPPMKPYNNKLDINSALTWGPKDIYGWMDHVAHNPQEYEHVPPSLKTNEPDEKKRKKGDRRLEAKKALLQDIRQKIIWLGIPVDGIENSGKYYKEPDPYQHIYRDKRGKGLRINFFNLNLMQITSADFKPGNLNSALKTMKDIWWCLYDLMGLFLSLISPAPGYAGGSAGKNWFFTPLTAVYGKWCYEIAPPEDGTKKEVKFPAVFQCTWSEGNGEMIYFFLGASAGGRAINGIHDSHLWVEHIRQNRWELCKGQTGQFRFNECPKRSGQKFGDCGETYPLRMLLVNNEEKSGVSGLALGWKSLESIDGNHANHDQAEGRAPPDGNPPKSYKNWKDIRKKLVLKDPCENCTYLILKSRGTPSNFYAASNKKRTT